MIIAPDAGVLSCRPCVAVLYSPLMELEVFFLLSDGRQRNCNPGLLSFPLSLRICCDIHLSSPRPSRVYYCAHAPGSLIGKESPITVFRHHCTGSSPAIHVNTRPLICPVSFDNIPSLGCYCCWCCLLQ